MVRDLPRISSVSVVAMRKILALILTMGLASGGCAWFGGSSSEETKPAQPQEQVAAPEPAPAPEVPAKDVKGKGKTKAKTKAEKQAEAKPVASKKVVKTEAQIAAELTMHQNGLPQHLRIRRRAEFVACYERGRRLHTEHFLVFVLSGNCPGLATRTGMRVSADCKLAIVV